MSIDPIAGLGLLGSLFKNIAKSLRRIRGTPKQRFAREVFSLFQIFEEAERDALAVISGLKAFAGEPTIGMRVHIIHGVGDRIRSLQKTCREFCYWTRRHEEWRNVLELLAPDTKKMLWVVRGREEQILKEEYDEAFDWYKMLTKLRSDLQAVESPDPKIFPDTEYLEEVIKQMEELLAAIQMAKKLVREFASSNLTIEDIF